MARICVVDDNPANLKLAALLLEHAGHSVCARPSAVGLAQALRDEPPDLVLMDIQMPGIDGIEAARRLRREPGLDGVRVVALTALVMKGDRERLLAAGLDGYIAKPIRMRLFLEEVARQLAAGSTHTSGEPAR